MASTSIESIESKYTKTFKITIIAKITEDLEPVSTSTIDLQLNNKKLIKATNNELFLILTEIMTFLPPNYNLVWEYKSHDDLLKNIFKKIDGDVFVSVYNLYNSDANLAKLTFGIPKLNIDMEHPETKINDKLSHINKIEFDNWLTEIKQNIAFEKEIEDKNLDTELIAKLIKLIPKGKSMKEKIESNKKELITKKCIKMVGKILEKINLITDTNTTSINYIVSSKNETIIEHVMTALKIQGISVEYDSLFKSEYFEPGTKQLKISW